MNARPTRLSLPASERERPDDVSWADFLAFYFQWKQGQHVSLIGPTGGGKTTLALEILPQRDYVLSIATKQRDEVLYDLERRGSARLERFELPGEIVQRIVLVAPLERGADSFHEQSRTIHEALVGVYLQGGWTVYLDETRYITDPGFLGLAKDVELLWQQG